MRYVLADNRHMINKDTHRFVRIGSLISENVDVPFYMSKFVEKKAAGSMIKQLWVVGTVTLNMLTIEFPDYYQSRENFEFKYHKVNIEYYDTNIRNVVRICLECTPVFGQVTYMDDGDNQLLGVHYKYDMPGKSFSFYDNFDGFGKHYIQHFDRVHGLSRVLPPHKNPNIYAYFGIRKGAYTLYYKGKQLGWQNYAFLAGTWAILLTDDLRFDSLVTLSGVDTYNMSIENVICTTNPNITKAVFLMR